MGRGFSRLIWMFTFGTQKLMQGSQMVTVSFAVIQSPCLSVSHTQLPGVLEELCWQLLLLPDVTYTRSVATITPLTWDVSMALQLRSCSKQGKERDVLVALPFTLPRASGNGCVLEMAFLSGGHCLCFGWVPYRKPSLLLALQGKDGNAKALVSEEGSWNG